MNNINLMNNDDQVISPVTIGVMISAFLEGDKKKGITYANFIADKYRDAGMEKAESIVRKRINGSYRNEPPVVLDGSEESNNSYHFEKLITISTTHVSGNTAAWINFYNTATIRYKKGEYGWVIFVMDYGDIYLPNDLRVVLDFARENGCDWICLDRDGEIVDLDIYEW